MSVDLDAHVVRGPAGETVLSPLEVKLLAYMAAHRGEIVPRARLLQEVWDYSPRTVSRAVDHTIARLRRKIESDPAEPRWLTSVRGSGYRLEGGTPPPPEGPTPPPSSLYGRTEELGRIQALLADDPGVVTLHGPPGVGKTRLCKEVLLAHPSHAFVGLIGVDDQAGVLNAVARALEVRLPADDGARWLGRVLHQRDGLVLALDNAEHVLDPLREIVPTWRELAPALRILVTSRAALALHGERRVAIPALSDGDAVALLVDRARRVRWDFAPGATELRALQRLAVEQLDGLPLAIELAAARLAVLDVPGLVQRIDDRFRLLRGEHTEAPWSSLEAALQWSWDLLDPPERRALAQCAVFRDGFTYDAAQGVLEDDALDLLGALVDHALVQRIEGTARFGMLQSVATFAAAQDPSDAAHRAHCAWFAGWAPPRVEALVGPEQRQAFDELAREEQNLRAALEHAVQHGNAESAGALALGVAAVARVDGRGADVERLLRPVLALHLPGSEVWTRLRVALAQSLKQGGAHQQALAVLTETQPLATGPADDCQVHLALADVHNDLGHAEASRAAAERARRLAADGVSPVREGIAHQLLGHLESNRGSVAEGETHATRALEIGRHTGHIALSVASLNVLAGCALYRHAPEEALTLADEALTLARQIRYHDFDVLLQVRRGYALLDFGRVEEACQVAVDAALAADRIGRFDVAYQVRLFAVLALVDAGRAEAADAVLDLLEADGSDPPVFTTGMVELRRAMVAALTHRTPALETACQAALERIRASAAGYGTAFGQAAVLLAGVMARRGEVDAVQQLAEEVRERLAQRPPAHREAFEQLMEAHRLEARRQHLLAEAASVGRARDELVDELEARKQTMVTRLMRLTHLRE